MQKDASGERKNATAPATSSPVPMRPIGGRSQPEVSPNSPRPATVVTIPGAVSPGQTAFTRIPCGPASTASICVSQLSARFETE